MGYIAAIASVVFVVLVMDKAFIRQWAQLSILWAIIALVPIGRTYINFTYDTSFYVVILVIGLIIIPVLIWWIKFLQGKAGSWAIIIAIQLTLSIVLSLAFHYASDEASTKMKMRVNQQQLDEMPVMQEVSFHLFSGNSYTVFTSLMMLSGLALLIEYNEQLRQRKIMEGQLQVNLALSQIKVLQSELQPHFIFNTLHSVSSLMDVDKKRAEQLIEKFSFLLQNYLDIIRHQFYTLEEETFFLKEYIEVQKLRHGGNIALDINIADDCLHANVPVILLQPIVENSIKHGWTNRQQILQINLTARRLDNRLHICISDNGAPVKVSERTGIGIRNLKERLTLLYPRNFEFTEYQQDGHNTEITMPIQP